MDEAYPAAAGLDLSHVIRTDGAGLVEGPVEVPTYEGILPAYAARPEGPGPFPLVIVAEEIFGVHEHVRDVCRRLAKQGYAAIAPELLHRHGDPGQVGDVETILHGIVAKVSDDEVRRDLQAVLAHLLEDRTSAVDCGRVAVVGFCWGGRVAWMAAANMAELTAAVAWYGLIHGPRDAAHPSQPIDHAGALRVPVLGLYGEQDTVVGQDNVARMRAALRSGSEIVTYPGAGHGFFADYRPSYVPGSCCGRVAADPQLAGAALQAGPGWMNRVLSPPVMPAAFQAHHVDVNGTRLCYVRGGSSDPIVLLHGWPQTWWAWRQIIPALAARGRTVIVPDLRGAGGSEKATGGYGKANQAEDIRQLVRGLGFDRIDLVGHDIGGMVAYAYACAHPGEVKRLVLVDLLLPALGLEPFMDPARGGSFHFGFFMVPDLAESLIEGREDAFFGRWFRRSLGRPDAMPPGDIEHYARIYAGHEALAAGFGHYRTLLQDIQHGRPFAATKLPMPVLAVAGERGVGAKLADGLRPATSNLRSVVLPACGHFVPEERPRELSRLLVEFLELDAVGAPEDSPVHPVTT